MKYLLITIFFIQVSAVAETNNSAVQICGEYPISVSGFETTALDCLEVIAGKIMNDLAVQICGEYPISVSGFETTALDCLEVIAGKIMNDLAVQTCDEYPISVSGFGTTKFACLKKLSAQSELAVHSSEKPVSVEDDSSSKRMRGLLEIVGAALGVEDDSSDNIDSMVDIQPKSRQIKNRGN